jgi:hypothetical protein
MHFFLKNYLKDLILRCVFEDMLNIENIITSGDFDLRLFKD